MLLIAGLVLYAGNYLIYKIAGISLFGSSSEETVVIPEDNGTSIIPTVSEAIENFPAMPAGIYSGVIYDVIPGQDSGLTVISLPEQNALIFIVAIEGWTPTLSSIPDPKKDQDNNSIRVTSNGIVLDMKGVLIDGAVEGEYVNAINGTIGKWKLQPIKEK